MDFDKKFHKPIYKEKGVFFETSPRKVYNIFIRAAGEADMKKRFQSIFTKYMLWFSLKQCQKSLYYFHWSAPFSAAGEADVKTVFNRFVQNM